ncbi:MAG TPA: VOC family protein [Candidatus Limnocylindrales bacterium]
MTEVVEQALAQRAGSVEIDHVLVAAPDLATAAADFARSGLASIEGGRHAAWGTATGSSHSAGRTSS